MINTTITLF